MQDRYAGDVGDFGKFSLLRALFGSDCFKLGVIWYLFPGEVNNDGRHIQYINLPKYLNRDEYLCQQLINVLNGQRSVASLETAELLPNNTVYFSERLNFHLDFPSQRQSHREQRQRSREEWLNYAINTVANCNVLFLDPDNGLEIATCPDITRMRAGKFAFYHEVLRLLEGKNVCVIYHHLNRNETHMNQIRERITELRRRINPTGRIFGLRFRPYSPRAYFIITDEKTTDIIRKKIQVFMANDANHQSGALWDSYVEEPIE